MNDGDLPPPSAAGEAAAEAEKVAGEEEEERCGGGDGEAAAEVAGEEAEEERCGGGGGEPERGGEALGRAIAAALGGVMREFDARAEGAAQSQGELALSLDRLTGELDKLLEDAPSPFVMQHAAKISSIRKRVAALNLLLRSVQRRIDNIDRILSTGIQSVFKKITHF
ncbi:hypothetical protein ACMD2_12945 [Ananas comosus]|uniref:Biogenesis of lysosome-related organelles complex 1 subunit 7 n=1 Tax=Ananas comosus TaxID=4615 RepID=A0A199UI49_ANACO|nr:hypothetical protein ACMD2_12945 [Ananas comosus]